MFRTSTPATDHAFWDRTEELKLLGSAVEQLRAGNPHWIALLGARKLGKTSLLLELTRRNPHRDVRFVVLDSFEEQPLSFEIFRRLALRTLDAFFAEELGVSLEDLSRRPNEYRATIVEAARFTSFERALRAQVLALCEAPADRQLAEFALGLSERLATALKLHCIVAWDEFQELAKLDSSRGKGVLPLARAIWQKHRRTAYFICGSERTLLERLVRHESSPFFQHFTLAELGPMKPDDAVKLLTRNAPPGRSIPLAVATKLAAVLGGHPFYLQLFGEVLTSKEPPYDEALVRQVFSEVLFSRTGRLGLYFENEFNQVVGNAATLAMVLEALSDGPARTTDVAKTIGASTGSTSRYLMRLGDVVQHQEDGRYALSDGAFGLWLRWRKPGGTVVPMTLVGDDAEREVAKRLAEMGFELVYQSRASRGAFDLLGVRSGLQLGIQVKRSPLPLRFSRAAWNRLHADAKRLDWQFVVAAVSPDGPVTFLDPGKAKVGRAVALTAGAQIKNLLAWLERRRMKN